MTDDPIDILRKLEAIDLSTEQGNLLALLTEAAILLLRRAVEHDRRWTAKD